MSEQKPPKMISVDAGKLIHDLRSALSNFRTAHEILLEPEPDRVDAKVTFSAAEKRLLDVIGRVGG